MQPVWHLMGGDVSRKGVTKWTTQKGFEKAKKRNFSKSADLPIDAFAAPARALRSPGGPGFLHETVLDIDEGPW